MYPLTLERSAEDGHKLENAGGVSETENSCGGSPSSCSPGPVSRPPHFKGSSITAVRAANIGSSHSSRLE